LNHNNEGNTRCRNYETEDATNFLVSPMSIVPYKVIAMKNSLYSSSPIYIFQLEIVEDGSMYHFISFCLELVHIYAWTLDN